MTQNKYLAQTFPWAPNLYIQLTSPLEDLVDFQFNVSKMEHLILTLFQSILPKVFLTSVNSYHCSPSFQVSHLWLSPLPYFPCICILLICSAIPSVLQTCQVISICSSFCQKWSSSVFTWGSFYFSSQLKDSLSRENYYKRSLILSHSALYFLHITFIGPSTFVCLMSFSLIST